MNFYREKGEVEESKYRMELKPVLLAVLITSILIAISFLVIYSPSPPACHDTLITRMGDTPGNFSCTDHRHRMRTEFRHSWDKQPAFWIVTCECPH